VPPGRHQPAALQQARHLADRIVPADETAQDGREAVHAVSGADLRLPHAGTIAVAKLAYSPGRARPGTVPCRIEPVSHPVLGGCREEAEAGAAEPVQHEVRVEAAVGHIRRMPTYRSATASQKYS
jgi:hypothetical protein